MKKVLVIFSERVISVVISNQHNSQARLDGFKGFLYYVKARGAVAQLGEYVTGSHGVAGSSPVSSTIFLFPDKAFIPQLR